MRTTKKISFFFLNLFNMYMKYIRPNQNSVPGTTLKQIKTTPVTNRIETNVSEADTEAEKKGKIQWAVEGQE